MVPLPSALSDLHRHLDGSLGLILCVLYGEYRRLATELRLDAEQARSLADTGHRAAFRRT